MKSYHLTQDQVRDIGEKLRIKGELTTTNLVNAVLDQVLGEPVGAIWENTDYGKGEVTGHFVGKIKDKQPKFIKLTKLYAPKEKS